MSSNAGSKGIIAQATNSSTSDRRRSSAGSSAGKFAGLMSQKRNSSDINASARKASFAEQQAPSGFLGNMWNSWTKGSGAGASGPNAGK